MNTLRPIEWQLSSGENDLSPTTLATLEQATTKEQMIPLTAETVEGHQYRIIAWSMGELAAYAAVGAPYDFKDKEGAAHGAIELGGAVVLENFRGQGLAGKMLEKRVEILEDSPNFPSGTRAVVFTNEKSRGYVSRRGFRPLAPEEALSETAFELCDTCTHCPADIRPTQDPTACCDYDGILVKEIVK